MGGKDGPPGDGALKLLWSSSESDSKGDMLPLEGLNTDWPCSRGRPEDPFDDGEGDKDEETPVLIVSWGSGRRRSAVMLFLGLSR